MRSIPGMPIHNAATQDHRSAQANLAGDAEIRWIERLQQRALPATGPLVAAREPAGSWIDRLQQRAANAPL